MKSFIEIRKEGFKKQGLSADFLMEGRGVRFHSTPQEPEGLKSRPKKGISCKAKGRRFFERILFKEGQSVRLNWEYQKPQGPKGAFARIASKP